MHVTCTCDKLHSSDRIRKSILACYPIHDHDVDMCTKIPQTFDIPIDRTKDKSNVLFEYQQT